MKGRVCLPPELRKELELKRVRSVILKETPEGFLLIPGRRVDFLAEFKKILSSKPKRVGKPENWPPWKMKKIWEGAA